MPRQKRRAEEEKEKTTINLPKGLKLQARLYAVRTGQDLQDVIAEGLRLVLAQKKGGT